MKNPFPNRDNYAYLITVNALNNGDPLSYEFVVMSDVDRPYISIEQAQSYIINNLEGLSEGLFGSGNMEFVSFNSRNATVLIP